MARLNTANRLVGAAPIWFLGGFIILCFLTGGGARGDIQSLAILRPVSALMLGYALWRIDRESLGRFRFLVVFALLLILLTAAHLIPLPPSLWTRLPGREIIVEIDQIAGLGAVWRPLSMAPSQTWNALLSLVGPLAVLLAMIRLPREQRYLLVPLLLLIGFASALFGLLQAIGPPNSALYLYNITNGGSAVGLFANRNHQAILLACLFPLLSAYASTATSSIEQAQFRRLVAIGLGLMLVPLLLVTGSRAGLLIGLVGMLAAAWLYDAPEINIPAKRKIRRFNPVYVYGGAGVALFAAITILMSRAEALDRLFAGESNDTARLTLWEPVYRLVSAYFPMGTGIGTFVEAYQMNETFNALSPDYLNHVHNDWLELAMTGGVPAIILAVLAVLGWGWQMRRLLGTPSVSRRSKLHGKLGAILIFMLALGSIGDYPLRVPSLAVLFVIAAVWMADAFSENAGRPSHARTS